MLEITVSHWILPNQICEVVHLMWHCDQISGLTLELKCLCCCIQSKMKFNIIFLNIFIPVGMSENGNMCLNPVPLPSMEILVSMIFLGLGMIFPRAVLPVEDCVNYILCFLQGFGIYSGIYTCHS